MKTPAKLLLAAMLGLAACMVFVSDAIPLTVEKVSLERMAAESNLIVYGTVVTSHSQWEGNVINTYTTIRVHESLKGSAGDFVTVKQMGGRVGDKGDEIPGSPKLKPDEDVVLFLVEWNGNYWIHSIVLGKFSVVTRKGQRVAYNDLNNVGLIDPTTGREVSNITEKINAFPLDSFMSEIRATVNR